MTEQATATPVTPRQPVVWLINQGGHDYETAKKFGRLMPMTTGGVNVFSPDRLMVTIGPRLKVAAVEDYLVVSGSPLLNALVVAMWLHRFEKANLLLWSHKAEEYKLVTVTASTVKRLATQDIPVAP